MNIMIIKKYFSQLIAGFTSPGSYKKWLILPARHIRNFFIISMLLVGLINGVVFSIKHVPEITNNFLSFQDELINKYPEDLTIQWQDQNLYLQPTENYQQLDLNLKDIASSNIINDLYIYYRANELATEEKQQLLNQNNTLFLVDNQQLSFRTEDGEVFNKNLNEIVQADNFSINKSDLPFLKEAINKEINSWQPKIQLVLPIIFSLTNLFANWLAALVFTTFLWLLLKAIPMPINKWQQAWKLTLSVLVTVNFLELLVQFIYPNLVINIRGLAFWLITGYVLISWKFPKFKIKQV